MKTNAEYELRYHHKADDDALVQPQVQALVRHEPPQQRVRVRVQGVVRRVLAQTQQHLAHDVDVRQDAHDALDEGP